MAAFNAEQYQKSIDSAAATVRRGVEELFRDGQPVFTPENHQRNMAGVLAPLQAVVAAAQTYATGAEQEAQKLEAAPFADPLEALTTDELVRLNASRSLTRDELTGLAPTQLQARLLTVAGSSNRVSQLAHLLVAKPIILASTDVALHSAWGILDEAVNGPQRAATTKAQATELRKQAANLAFYASTALADVDGSSALSDQRRRQEYAAYF